MGIEPTQDSCEPHTGFEDQGHHQAPFTSASRRRAEIVLVQNVAGPEFLGVADAVAQLYGSGHDPAPFLHSFHRPVPPSAVDLPEGFRIVRCFVQVGKPVDLNSNGAKAALYDRLSSLFLALQSRHCEPSARSHVRWNLPEGIVITFHLWKDTFTFEKTG